MTDVTELYEGYMAGTQLLVANFVSSCEADASYLTEETAAAFTNALATLDSEFQSEGSKLTSRVAAITDLTADETNRINEINDYYNNVLTEFNKNIAETVGEWISG